MVKSTYRMVMPIRSQMSHLVDRMESFVVVVGVGVGVFVVVGVVVVV